MKMIDYSLYLVTDSTMVPESSTFLKQVEDSVNNGVTIVQLREKSTLTAEFIERAKQVHAITSKRNIPLIINDRVDIALAIDAEGVHVGQDDMPPTVVRQLIGPNKILGVSCSTPEEVDIVTKENVANYIGLGAVYPTDTKFDMKYPNGVGPIGVRKMLQVLKRYNESNKNRIYCVAIGGINHTNVSKVIYQCQIPGQPLDGVAVVSCIMASPNAAKATNELVKCVAMDVPWAEDLNSYNCPSLLQTESNYRLISKPLVHHITNNVVKNFSANVTLAIGACPIMSELAEEFEEFASSFQNMSVLINLGTPSKTLMDIFKKAISVYNKYGKPIILDPVACGATSVRLRYIEELLNYGQISVIKGNVGEILSLKCFTDMNNAIGNGEKLMHGVDSIANASEETILTVGQNLSKHLRCVIVITGPMNYIINSDRVVDIPGGSELMGLITGTGCSLGSVIGAFVACKDDGLNDSKFSIFDSVVKAVKLYNLCGKKAAQMTSSPSSFMTCFLDELYYNTHDMS